MWMSDFAALFSKMIENGYGEDDLADLTDE